MEPKMIKLLALLNNLILITQIEEVGADIGEPDCKLIEPYVVNGSGTTLTLEPWLVDHTNQNTFMLQSDKILTIVEPKPTILEKYQTLIK